ncbi:hypothetical protein [Chryseobacterium indoltheticum]|uniref:hypothetical protein n=1 Tax=Chryseobacterium indoltheticum TaxID=254 RepID=UPI003F4991F6
MVNFIENAFKYGFNAAENSKISVKIVIQEGILHFNVFNNIVNQNMTDEESLKVGLKNTTEHLNQVYFDKHTLTVNEDEKTYEADLKINLI